MLEELREQVYRKRKELAACFNAQDKNRFNVVQEELILLILELKKASKKKILTAYINPPIPMRWLDWVAYYDGEDEGLSGTGETEQEAINDLLEKGETE